MPLSIGISIRVHVFTVFFAAICHAQTSSAPISTNQPASFVIPPTAEAQTLGPGDQIQVKALHAEELGDKPVRVDAEGYIMLPGLGRVHAGGFTTEAVAAEIRERLGKTIKDPEVAIDIVELKSQPVSVLGAVKTPGVYQIVGKKRLLEVLAMAGGLDPEAGDTIRVTRLLPGADSSSGRAAEEFAEKVAEKFKVTDIRISDLMEGNRPEMNLVVHADDVVTIPRARLVYVIGQVHKAGGFVLRDRQNLSVLQALSMAEGTLPNAGVVNARILRQVEPHGVRQEIPVNVKAILAGKKSDEALLPDDVLFIPNNTGKAIAMRALEIAIQTGSGVAIWRQY